MLLGDLFFLLILLQFLKTLGTVQFRIAKQDISNGRELLRLEMPAY